MDSAKCKKLIKVMEEAYKLLKKESLIVEITKWTKFGPNTFFNTKNEVILSSTEINEWFNVNVLEKLLTKIEDFQEKESGWSLLEIINLAVNINRYIPIHGGLSTFIELLKNVQNKKAVVNILNNDPYCFLWSVTAALHPAKQNVQSISSYSHFSSILKYEGINFPIGLKDIPKFEAINDLVINVYGIERDANKGGNEIVPLYLSQHRSNKSPIHLLMVESENDVESDDDLNMEFLSKSVIYHFAWIRNLSRLLISQISKHNGHIRLCDRCLCHFQTENSFEKHKLDCANINKCRVILPNDEEKLLKFKNYKYQESVPFVIYAVRRYSPKQNLTAKLD
ncbi:uncharacterized protein LOC112494342 [Cephus cinctus]|uniref:Uncharacterized protein LOC112494342 n=1 Tax=Cephus cinctus TaxID=211228 RepID=A0AAJ7RH42_CEPCN|nr:uncharacterized protein LOC112494342 [Cephus cinctus]